MLNIFYRHELLDKSRVQLRIRFSSSAWQKTRDLAVMGSITTWVLISDIVLIVSAPQGDPKGYHEPML